jgi:hypothetical protein
VPPPTDAQYVQRPRLVHGSPSHSVGASRLLLTKPEHGRCLADIARAPPIDDIAPACTLGSSETPRARTAITAVRSIISSHLADAGSAGLGRSLRTHRGLSRSTAWSSTPLPSGGTESTAPARGHRRFIDLNHHNGR